MSEELAIRDGDSVEKKMDIYNAWADKYDADMVKRKFRGPEIAAETCAGLVPCEKERPQTKVADIACGTGLVGEKLSKHGFKFIDGIDGSQKMLEVADSKSVYRKLICDLVQTEKPLQIENGYYDIAVMSGGIGNNHIPIDAFREMIRIVKKGGYVVNVTCPRHIEKDVFYEGRFFQDLEAIEKDGLWKKEVQTQVDGYLAGEPGVILIYRVL